MAEEALDDEMSEILSVKASMTGQAKNDLDHSAVREDILRRTFLCPNLRDQGKLNLQSPRNVYSRREEEGTATRSVVIVKVPVQDEGQCIHLYNANCCNHWVSSEALEQYIDSEVVRSVLSEALIVRGAERAFSAYREAHMGQTVKCPKPTCDYWCEIEDDRGLQDTGSLLLDSDGQLSDDNASSASSMQPGLRPYNEGYNDQRAMQLHDSVSEDSSDDEVHGIRADPFGLGASTSSGSASYPVIIPEPSGRNRHRMRYEDPSVTSNPPNQEQAQAVVAKGREMMCEVCDIRYCLYCSQQVGKPVRAHGRKPCETVIEERRMMGMSHSAARKALAAAKSQKKVRGILWQECPKCKIQAWKSSGECNMMTCKCGTKFCFLCGKDISGVGHNHFVTGRCKDGCWHRPEGGMFGFDPCTRGAPGCDTA